MKLLSWVPFGRVAEIAADELAERLRQESRPQIVDVRTAREFAAGHISGALNAPVTRLASTLDGLALDPTRPVVAICLTAHRSIPAVRLLQERGFDTVQLAGGMMAWRAQRFPEERG